MYKFVIGMDKKIKLTIIGAGNIGGATALGLAELTTYKWLINGEGQTRP